MCTLEKFKIYLGIKLVFGIILSCVGLMKDTWAYGSTSKFQYKLQKFNMTFY